MNLLRDRKTTKLPRDSRQIAFALEKAAADAAAASRQNYSAVLSQFLMEINPKVVRRSVDRRPSVNAASIFDIYSNPSNACMGAQARCKYPPFYWI